MKKFRFILLLLFVFAISNQKLNSQHLTDLGYFGEIIDLHFLDDSTVIIVSNNFEKHVTIFSLATDKIIHQYIPEGRGPNEALSIESSALFRNKLYLKESNGQITTIDLKNDTITEKFVLPAQSNFMTINKENLVLGSKFIINPNMIKRLDLKLPIGYIIGKDKLQIQDTIKLDLKSLNLNTISDIRHIDNIFIKTYIAKISATDYLVALEGINRIFRINPSLPNSDIILKEYEIDLPNIFSLQVIKNETYGYGVKIPSTLTNFFNFVEDNESKVAFSFGNSLQNIPYGYAVYSPELDDFIYNNLSISDLEGTFQFKKHGEILGGFEHSFSNLFLIDPF